MQKDMLELPISIQDIWNTSQLLELAHLLQAPWEDVLATSHPTVFDKTEDARKDVLVSCC